MGIHVLRRVADLGDGLVLAPERFDPRRRVEVVARCCLSDVVDIVALDSYPADTTDTPPWTSSQTAAADSVEGQLRAQVLRKRADDRPILAGVARRERGPRCCLHAPLRVHEQA